MFENLRPVGDRILVKRLQVEERTESGLYIPDSAKEKSQTGTVLEVGPGRRDTSGNLTPLDVKKGDTICFGKYVGTEMADDLLIIKEDDILGIMQR